MKSQEVIVTGVFLLVILFIGLQGTRMAENLIPKDNLSVSMNETYTTATEGMAITYDLFVIGIIIFTGIGAIYTLKKLLEDNSGGAV